MASLDELIKKKIRLFEQIPKDMATSAERAQLDAWRTVEPLLRDMDVDSTGNITQTDANINRIGLIADELNKVLAGGEYKEAVSKFLSQIEAGVNLSTEIAQKFEAGFEPTEAQRRLVQISKQNAINSFFGSGLRERVTQPFLEQLTANIAARAPLREAVKALSATIIGDSKLDGNLLGHIKTTATTAQAVADRSFSAAVNEEIGIQWFQYLGGEIPTTRPFCEHRQGEIFHRKEIEAWGRGQNSADINDIKNGTWAGRIDGTDSRTIFTFVGGWNCRHDLVPVPASKVPETVKARARAEGYID
jgi:hypothetical protein